MVQGDSEIALHKERRLEPASPWAANAWEHGACHCPLMVQGDSEIAPPIFEPHAPIISVSHHFR